MDMGLNWSHCGVSKTQRQWFYDENRDDLDDKTKRNQMLKKRQMVDMRKVTFCQSNFP